MWPWPGKEPLVDVDRAVLVAIHHQAAVLTAIRPDPQGHIFFAFADMTGLRRLAFAYYKQFFPNMQTLIGQHLHKAVETPIVVDHAGAGLSRSRQASLLSLQ